MKYLNCIVLVFHKYLNCVIVVMATKNFFFLLRLFKQKICKLPFVADVYCTQTIMKSSSNTNTAFTL